MYSSYRTDMAAEAYQLRSHESAGLSSLPGVRAAEEKLYGLDVSAVEILDAAGAGALGKGVGKYYTLTLPAQFDRGSPDFISSVKASCALLRRCLCSRPSSVLVAALGNPDITPDALGSLAASSLLVTRHLIQSSPRQFSPFASVSVCRTGVLGTSGIESAAHISLLCRELHPDAVIVIDALAGCDADRLCRTVQFTDAGIAPGSGVGNNRQELNHSVLGVPVVAVGMPTVMDAGLFGADALKGMFVTPRSIDSVVRRAAKVIAYSLNMALHDGLTVEDMDVLVCD